MAQVLVFCSKTVTTDAFGTVGVEDIALRHPSTHATGWQSWQIRFPADPPMTFEKREEMERSEWNLVRFQSGLISRSMLLRDMASA